MKISEKKDEKAADKLWAILGDCNCKRKENHENN
jgi:hypothetical protein